MVRNAEMCCIGRPFDRVSGLHTRGFHQIQPGGSYKHYTEFASLMQRLSTQRSIEASASLRMLVVQNTFPQDTQAST